MELTKNDPAVCPDSIDAPDSSTGAVEIDLYDELVTFAALSPEEQSRLGRSDKERAQPDQESAAQAEGAALSQPDLAPGPVELAALSEPDLAPGPVELAALSEPDLAPGPVELDFAIQHAETGENRPKFLVEPAESSSGTLKSRLPSHETAAVPFEPVLTDAQTEPGVSEAVLDTSTALTGEDEESSRPNMFGEPIEPGSGTLELSSPSSATPEEVQLEPALTEAQSQTIDALPALDTSAALAEDDEQSTPRESVPSASAMEVVEPVTGAPAAEAGESETSKPSGATNGARTSGIVGPRPSGPLSGFNLPPEIVYTGAMSRGVCLACGAESGADDLFCLTCGVFIDEIASTLPSNPTCAECHERIDADEIFCPWCGSSVAE